IPTNTDADIGEVGGGGVIMEIPVALSAGEALLFKVTDESTFEDANELAFGPSIVTALKVLLLPDWIPACPTRGCAGMTVRFNCVVFSSFTGDVSVIGANGLLFVVSKFIAGSGESTFARSSSVAEALSAVTGFNAALFSCK